MLVNFIIRDSGESQLHSGDASCEHDSVKFNWRMKRSPWFPSNAHRNTTKIDAKNSPFQSHRHQTDQHGQLRRRQTTRIKLPKDNVTIRTLNVRTLNKCRKLTELTYAFDQYRLDIIGLSESYKKNCDETTTEEGHGFWFSGDDARQQ